ncbi:MAG: 50S ribosomal protein L3 N(5)-glutamine methyltransferase [Cycloclasticus sp.]|nr:MAG: 50S ribosomal protein L3 N(5)-glutamine methyltransferase [Cycloclasticus sp.]
MATNSELISRGESLFLQHSLHYGHGTTTALDEAAYIVLTVTGNITATDDSVYEQSVDDEQQKVILNYFERRITEKIPAAYLLGEAWFAGLPFFVNEDVLVPRSPFAELIMDQFSPWLEYGRVNYILDLCTGSGCIGIACATRFPDADVVLADISPSALRVAQINIEKHDVSSRVTVVESDLFVGLKARKFDLIVSNPPYVGHEELNTLPDEFYKEPQLGLDGGKSGLDLVHKILASAADYLNDDGVLYVEVGNTDIALQKCYPHVPFLWQEFEYGGHGIFMLTKSQLLEYKEQFLVNLIN